MKDLNAYELQYDLDSEFNSIELTEIHIGDLNLPTGKIVAADPFFADGQQAFARSVEPDKYPVYIYMAEIDELHHRVAYVKIKFRPETATKHILALTEDLTTEELDELGEEEFFGFPVDSGLAALLDAQTNEQLTNRMDLLLENKPESNYYDEVLAKEFAEYSGKNQFSRALGDWNDHRPSTDSDNNVIMFASGWGDGYYPAYWGLNDSGDAIELVIDFLLNDFEEGDENEDFESEN